MPPSSSVRTSYGDAAKSSLPSVSLLFASQSRPNVSPGNGHEFYSGLIFLVPIVRGAPRALCYQSSPPLPLLATSGLYSELFRHSASEEVKKRSTRVFDDSSLRTNFTPPSPPPSLPPPAPASPLFLLLLLIPSLSQTRIPQTPPGSVKYVRDARLDAGDLFARKCRARRILLFISGYLG